MSAADTLLSKLDGVQGRGPRWRAICPAHESMHRTRTLSIFETDDGRVLLRCHAGCDVEAIVHAVGLDLADLFLPRVDDDQRGPRVRKPWSARHVIESLRAELGVAAVIVADVANARPHSEKDRDRARVALERIAHAIEELSHAH